MQRFNESFSSYCHFFCFYFIISRFSRGFVPRKRQQTTFTSEGCWYYLQSYLRGDGIGLDANANANDIAAYILRGKQFTVCTEIAIILGTVRFTIRGGRLQYKQYDAHFFKKSSVELPFSSFGDHLINILRKVNRLIYTFNIN